MQPQAQGIMFGGLIIVEALPRNAISQVVKCELTSPFE